MHHVTLLSHDTQVQEYHGVQATIGNLLIMLRLFGTLIDRLDIHLSMIASAIEKLHMNEFLFPISLWWSSFIKEKTP